MEGMESARGRLAWSKLVACPFTYPGLCFDIWLLLAGMASLAGMGWSFELLLMYVTMSMTMHLLLLISVGPGSSEVLCIVLIPVSPTQ